MVSKNIVIRKPNHTITITNRDLSLTARKTYNAIIHFAQEQLIKNPDQRVFEMSLTEVKQAAGLAPKSNAGLEEAIHDLHRTVVQVIEKKKNEFGLTDSLTFNLLSQTLIRGRKITLEFPSVVRNSLGNLGQDIIVPYTRIPLDILKDLTSVYAITLMENILRYKDLGTWTWTVEEWKLMTGIINKKGYSNFSLLRQKTIEPAIKEINAKTQYRVKYTTEKRGRKIDKLKFSWRVATPKKKATEGLSPEETRQLFEDSKDSFETDPKGHLIRLLGYDAGIIEMSQVDLLSGELVIRLPDGIPEEALQSEALPGSIRHQIKSEAQAYGYTLRVDVQNAL